MTRPRFGLGTFSNDSCKVSAKIGARYCWEPLWSRPLINLPGAANRRTE